MYLQGLSYAFLKLPSPCYDGDYTINSQTTSLHNLLCVRAILKIIRKYLCV